MVKRSVLFSLAVLMAAVLVVTPVASARPPVRPKAHAAGLDCICTLGGGAVGFGVGAATAEVSGGLALVGFTAGCQLAVTQGKPAYITTSFRPLALTSPRPEPSVSHP